MMLLLFLLFLVLYLYFTLWVTIGNYKFYKKKKISNEKNTISLQDITIIIPFRNETKRIQPLIKALLDTKKYNLKVIAVDDHSTDNTSNFLEKQLKELQLIILKNNGLGKKSAIKTAIERIETTYVLTWDADITFNQNYLQALEKLPKVDMNILPVEFTGNFWTRFLSLDTVITQITNIAQAGYTNPIICSGANLLFSKEAYLSFENIDDHNHIQSGDDQFLLAAFKKNNARIVLLTEPVYAVKTPAEKNIINHLQQRLRWFLKTPAINDIELKKITLMASIVQGVFWFTLCSSFYLFPEFSIWIFGLKILLDSIISSLYFKNKKQMSKMIILPFYNLIFPLQFVLMIIIKYISPLKWKDRTIKNN